MPRVDRVDANRSLLRAFVTLPFPFSPSYPGDEMLNSSLNSSVRDFVFRDRFSRGFPARARAVAKPRWSLGVLARAFRRARSAPSADGHARLGCGVDEA